MGRLVPTTPIPVRAFLATIFVGLAFTVGSSANAENYRVKDQAAYEAVVKSLVPGDTVILANGVWRDFEIVFEAHGEEGAPITLTAETPGKVIISGKSNLRLGGEHLVVTGLVFRDGYSPTKELISFRRDSETLASNSRLTQTVIDGFNNPDRAADDNWIAIFGKNNRIDHNYIAGKATKGATLVVRLNSPESRENGHIIEQNFFGRRPPLGGNGGETIRIGVSDYSRTTSNTFVVRNYFEHCDGEVEIISNKSEGNTISENVFYESRGALVLRHGGRNSVTRNIFFGNGVSDTGGVRVINDNQTVTDNYFEGLTGAKFLSALTVMNGVPNSPENRYHQVENATIKNNSFVDIAQIGFGVGSDDERSAPPVSSIFSKNLIVTDSETPVAVFDDISGITVTGNYSDNAKLEPFGATISPEIVLARAENGLLYPVDPTLDAGAPRDLSPLARKDAGPSWFKKPTQSNDRTREIKVKAGAKALRRALEKSDPGDTLILQGARYELDGPLVIAHEVTLEGDAGAQAKPKITGNGEWVFELRAGAHVTASNLRLEASNTNRAMFYAKGATYSDSYSLSLLDIEVDGANGLADGVFLRADKATFAEAIKLDRLNVSAWQGPFIAMSGVGMEGWYLADDIIVKNSAFDDIAGPLIQFGREGRDESTFGPRVSLSNLSLSRVGVDQTAIELNRIDGFELSGSSLNDSGEVRVLQRVLGLPFVVKDNAFESADALEILDWDDKPMVLEPLVAKQ